MIVGVIENDTIINVVVVDTLAAAEEMFPAHELIDLTENPENIGMYSYRENGTWHRYIPSE